jgi:2-oxoglutarate ferredoxin oxidoreductase subunit alpha
MAEDGLVWMVGGPQGSGVDSAAQLFAQTVARGGLHVYGQREYYSNIKGKHSYTKIRTSPDEVRSPIDEVHFLATYENETLARHVQDYRALVDGGGVLYDPSETDATVEDIRFMDQRVKDDIAEDLGRPTDEITIQDLVDKAEEEGVRVFEFPYEELQKEIADELGMDDHHRLQILKNTMATAASIEMLEFGLEHLNGTIEAIFGDKSERIVEMNQTAARISAEYMRENYEPFDFVIDPAEPDEERLYMQGTDAVAMGKMVAGCRMQTYYPISPATDESVYLEGKSSESNVAVVQTEDELAAVDMALGAALTGARAATSTSGPGVNLMVEGLGFAGLCEVPLVLINYQRGGPSTGMPTRTGQADLQFTLKLGNGEYPRLVLAPGDLDEMFHDTVDAFNYAERYQTPVLMVPDKDLAGNSHTVEAFDVDRAEIDRGKLLDEDELAETSFDDDSERHPRFAASDDGISPRSVIGQEHGIHWLTSDEHTEVGHITEDVVKREQIMQKRMQKLGTAREEIPDERMARKFGPEQAEVTIVSWGTPKGAILDAMESLNQDGDLVNFVQVRILSPFPDHVIQDVFDGANTVVSVENNYSGQLARLVRERIAETFDHNVVKYNGRPIMQNEIEDTVRQVRKGIEDRIVLRGGI